MNPNYFAVKPKGETAENQLTSVKNEIKKMGTRWLGGEKVNGRWECPDKLYYAVPISRKQDLLELFERIGLPFEEVELEPIALPSPPKKHRKKAANIEKMITDKKRAKVALLERRLREEEVQQKHFDGGEISEKEMHDKVEEIRMRYKKDEDALDDQIRRNEEASVKIFVDGEMSPLPEDYFLVNPGETHLAAKKGIEILCDPEHGFFQRSGRLVRLHRYQIQPNNPEIMVGVHRPEGALMIEEPDEITLVKKLSELHMWKQPGGKEGVRRIDFPNKAAKMMVSEKGTGFLFLKGFICSPTIREDGSLLDKPGYDHLSGLFLDACGTQFPPIPENPTKEDALKSLERLNTLLKGFPFEDSVSQSVALAALLTVPIRRSLALAPIFANDASTASSGKTLLAKVCSYMGTDKPPTLISPTKNEEEMRKRLASVLVKGDLVTVIDNLDFPFESRDLCTISTSAHWEERILGVSKNALIATNSLLIITGNNLSFVGDLCTRVLKCRLIPKEERPEERTFDLNLNEYVPQHRGELVCAALTIIRAYIVAGRPLQGQLSGFREYADWSMFIREPLIWLGCSDPCESIQRVQDLDPKRMEMEALFTALYNYPADSFTVSQLIKTTGNATHREGNDHIQALFDALVEISAKRDGTLCPVKIGNKLREYKDRVCNGKRLAVAGKDRENKTIWKMISA